MSNLQGKRVEDNTPIHVLNPGEYCKYTLDSVKPYWQCCLPNGSYGNLTRHNILEHKDGTITVTPSILTKGSQAPWHGYLLEGIFKEC